MGAARDPWVCVWLVYQDGTGGSRTHRGSPACPSSKSKREFGPSGDGWHASTDGDEAGGPGRRAEQSLERATQTGCAQRSSPITPSPDRRSVLGRAWAEAAEMSRPAGGRSFPTPGRSRFSSPHRLLSGPEGGRYCLCSAPYSLAVHKRRRPHTGHTPYPKPRPPPSARQAISLTKDRHAHVKGNLGPECDLTAPRRRRCGVDPRGPSTLSAPQLAPSCSCLHCRSRLTLAANRIPSIFARRSNLGNLGRRGQRISQREQTRTSLCNPALRTSCTPTHPDRSDLASPSFERRRAAICTIALSSPIAPTAWTGSAPHLHEHRLAAFG